MTKFGSGLVAATVACLIAAAAPAAAESQAHRDFRGDVEVIEGIRQAPTRAPNIDILSVRNTYSGRTLKLAMKVDDLRERGYAAQWNLRVGKESYYLYYVASRRGAQAGFLHATDGPHRLPRVHQRQPAGCRGAKVAVRGNYVLGVVPRHCIDGADQLRVASFMTRYAEDGYRVDDAWFRGYDTRPQPKYGPKYGPTLRRN